VKLRRGACFLGAVSVLAVTCPTLADAPPPIVRVYVAGSPEAVSGTRDAVQELCARSNVAVVVHDAAGADEALLATTPTRELADAYLDLRAGTPTRVVVVDGETRQDLERRVLPEGTSLEMSIEIASRVVCAAVESSLAARAQAVAGHTEDSEPKRPKPPGQPPHSDLAAWESRFTVFAAAENFGVGFRGGVGGALAATANRFRLRPGALLSISGYPATDLAAAGGLATFGMTSARLMPMLEWQTSNALSLFAAAGAGIDRVGIEAERPPAGAVARTPPAMIIGVVSGMLGVRFRFSRGVGALIALDADVALSRTHYVIATQQGSQSFFEAARTRPVGLAGLCVSFGGGAAEPASRQGALP
jgi:hypothetical protein